MPVGQYVNAFFEMSPVQMAFEGEYILFKICIAAVPLQCMEQHPVLHRRQGIDILNRVLSIFPAPSHRRPPARECPGGG